MNSRGASAEGRGYLSNGGSASPFLKPGGEFFIYFLTQEYSRLFYSSMTFYGLLYPSTAFYWLVFWNLLSVSVTFYNLLSCSIRFYHFPRCSIGLCSGTFYHFL